MGVTVMIIMGLLSVLAISSIDFDSIEEIRSRIDEAREDQEETFEDTSDLGWLDVPDEGVDGSESDLSPFFDGFLNFATASDAAEAPPEPAQAGVEMPVGQNIDPFDSFAQEEFAQDDGAYEPSLTSDTVTDLWPLEGQSQSEDELFDEPELIELEGFNPEEDTVEFPYVPKRDDDGNIIAPTTSVTHHDGWTEVGVDDTAHALAHSSNNDFKGLEPEDLLLRKAA